MDERRTVEVVDDGEPPRYSIRVDGAVVGVAEYVDHDGARVFTHTEVDEAHSGQGLASRLVEAALTDAAERDLPVLPLCPYVARWLDRHPELAGVVAEDVDARTRSFLEDEG